MRYPTLATCALLVAVPSVAHANLVLFNGTPETSGAQVSGLGSITALLSMVGAGGTVDGSVVPTGTPPNGQLITTTGSAGTFGNTSPTAVTVGTGASAGLMGWDDGAHVGLGINFNVPNSLQSVTLNSMTVNLYTVSGSTATLKDMFSIAGPITFNRAALDLTPGAGNGTVNFVLSPTEQQFYNLLLTQVPQSDIRIGIAASVSGLAGNQGVAIRGFDQSGSSLGLPPEPDMPLPPEIPLPASLPLFASGLASMGLLVWRRKRKSTSSIL